MLPRVSTRFLFPLFRLEFLLFCFSKFNLSFFFLLVSICNYCCPELLLTSCLLSSSPFESPERVDLPAKNFPKSGPVLYWDRTRGTRSGCPKSRSIARHSGRIVALGNAFRTSRTRCVCWFMYVRTYDIHTYIHTYMYIFIYRYIFGYLLSFGPGTKETRITLSLSFFSLSFGRKISRFRKMEKSRPFSVNFETP